MTVQISTGLRNHLLSSGSLKNALDGGKIMIYKGTAPTTADAAASAADLVSTITLNAGATGLSFDTAASNGVISKPIAAVWSGTNAATGTVTWYRHVASTDDGTLATSQPRIQGNVGIQNAALNLSSVSLTTGATQTIDFYSVALPTA